MSTPKPAAAIDPKGKLTPKQRLFVAEYVIDGNGVQAYFRAFGRNKSNGQSRSYFAAGEQARRLLAKPEIRTELAAAEAEYARRIRVSKLRVLREIALVAFADPVDAYEPDPTGGQDVPRSMSKIPAATRRTIQSSKTKRRRIAGEGQELYEVEEVAYTFHNKLAALEALGKKLGLFKDDGQPPDTMTEAQKIELVRAILGGAGTPTPEGGK